MTDKELIDLRLNHYAQLFDQYLQLPSPPQRPEENSQDPLHDYLLESLSDQYLFNRAKQDITWCESYKNSLLSFFTAMLQSYLALERDQQKEMQILQHFFDADIPNRRKQWAQILAGIQDKYSSAELNTFGLIQQFQQSDPSQHAYIFEAMRQQWTNASHEQLLAAKRRCLQHNRMAFEKNLRDVGSQDYEFFTSLQKEFFKYPILKEIVDMMGREKHHGTEQKDATITKYIPLLLAPAKTIAEVDGVTIGNTIQQALPSEMVYLSEHDTEDIFYHRFATNQLQQLASKPPMKKKSDRTQQDQPRLCKGPIIVSVDTSGSMNGRPMQVAHSLLFQLLYMAKKQKRACYLITYSVRAQAIDLASPSNWRLVKNFLQRGFSGGTDGNQMLQTAIATLHSKQYAMADVLIISDFEWPCPHNNILKMMDHEKSQGTKFYGLGIRANFARFPHDWPDQLWSITNL